MINVHASLLRANRGAAPVHRAIIEGESRRGHDHAHREGARCGPMLAETIAPLDRTRRATRSSVIWRGLDSRLPGGGRRPDRPGPRAGQDTGRYGGDVRAPVTRDDGVIDWSWPAIRVHNLIRDCIRGRTRSAFLHGRRLILLRSRPLGRIRVRRSGTRAKRRPTSPGRSRSER